MTNNQYFETMIFGTDQKIKIQLDQVLEIQDRASIPGKKNDQARVFIIGESGLIVINLEEAKKLEDLLKNLK